MPPNHPRRTLRRGYPVVSLMASTDDAGNPLLTVQQVWGRRGGA